MNGMYTCAASMESLLRQQDAISMNLANLSTEGYKKRIVSFQSHLKEVSRSEIPKASQQILCDLSPGSFRDTGRSLDLALEGEGFFTIEAPRGQRYTRKGDFATNTLGELVTKSGYRVLGTAGPIVVGSGGEEIFFEEHGKISKGGQQLDTLKVVSFSRGAKLIPEEGGLFYSSEPPEGPADAKVRQGRIEESNVDPLEEMVDMIFCLRLYEANQKAIETMRVAMEKAVNK